MNRAFELHFPEEDVLEGERAGIGREGLVAFVGTWLDVESGGF